MVKYPENAKKKTKDQKKKLNQAQEQPIRVIINLCEQRAKFALLHRQKKRYSWASIYFIKNLFHQNRNWVLNFSTNILNRSLVFCVLKNEILNLLLQEALVLLECTFLVKVKGFEKLVKIWTYRVDKQIWLFRNLEVEPMAIYFVFNRTVSRYHSNFSHLQS